MVLVADYLLECNTLLASMAHITEDDVYQIPNPRQPQIFDKIDINEIISGQPQIFDFDMEEDIDIEYSEISEERGDDAYYGVGIESLLTSKSLNELWKEMNALDHDGQIRKLVLKNGKKGKLIDPNGKIVLNYDLFLNGEAKPFAYRRVSERSPQYLSLDDFVCGIAEAIKSMEVGEKSQFIISWKCAYGKMGCPPMIPPEADILAVIEIIDVVPFVTKTAMLEEGVSEFHSEIHKIKVLQMEGKKAFQKRNMELSLTKYKKGMAIINYASTNTEEEKEQLKEMKITFLLNLALVHNKLKNSTKALFHCDKALELDPNNEKAIFHRGRALIQMNEFTKAATELLKGQRLFPENISFGKELLKLEEKQTISISAELGKAIIS